MEWKIPFALFVRALEPNDFAGVYAELQSDLFGANATLEINSGLSVKISVPVMTCFESHSYWQNEILDSCILVLNSID